MRRAIAIRDADLHLNVFLDVSVDRPIAVAYRDGWFDGFSPEAVEEEGNRNESLEAQQQQQPTQTP